MILDIFWHFVNVDGLSLKPEEKKQTKNKQNGDKG